ncbi:rCG38669 [Rattus norvegicus]|uniref:RCG38669 n=1 Tax=Rattus norvegicus TaxID=10116 RepID=A6KA40_RAT|nr:rCG38669 [Rattus norvegicus]
MLGPGRRSQTVWSRFRAELYLQHVTAAPVGGSCVAFQTWFLFEVLLALCCQHSKHTAHMSAVPMETRRGL